METIKNNEKNPHVFKVVILGDSGVGKTSFLHNFIFSKCKPVYLG